MILDKFLLENKGIYIFSDPAAENSILAIIDKLISNGKKAGQDFLVYTNYFKKSFSSYYDLISLVDTDERKISNILEKFKPTYIFTGTSLQNFEHVWRKVGCSKKIKVMSFIDHWTSYIERFMYQDEIIFGNEILVLNSIAKKEAELGGIPKELITVFENPYYDKVREFKPKISKEKFFKYLGLNRLKKTILFISDDIKKSFPENDNGNCVLGFDEYSVLNDILISFKRINSNLDLSDFQFVIKLHPKSEENKFDKLISEFSLKSLNIFCIKNCPPLEINYFSDFVFGMFSNMVIESFLMNKKLIRVQTGQIGDDLIKIKGIKDNVVKDVDKLCNEITNFLNT